MSKKKKLVVYCLNFGATPFNREGSGQRHVVKRRRDAGLV
jgi:hypothetical protein